MYTFMTGPEDNRQPVQARFSYMWRKIDGEWKILHHHSSALPSGAPAEVTQAQTFAVTSPDSDPNLAAAAAAAVSVKESAPANPFAFLSKLFS